MRRVAATNTTHDTTQNTRHDRSKAKNTRPARRHAHEQRAPGRRITSGDLGIQLSRRTEAEYFKWFLACLLFGKPIQQKVAARAYFTCIAAGLMSPSAITAAGWDKIVAVLDSAQYVRYDFSTATKLLDISRELSETYGSLTRLFAQSRDAADLSARLQAFKGIGPVTARIFLADLAPILFGK